jgi:hypothetical protein
MNIESFNIRNLKERVHRAVMKKKLKETRRSSSRKLKTVKLPFKRATFRKEIFELKIET